MKSYTIKDVIIITKDILGGISVPMTYMNEIAIPISHAIDNLNGCIDAINKADEEKAAQEVEEDDGSAGNPDAE